MWSTNHLDYSSYKLRLFPTKEQIQIFNEYFGACRFVYNLGIDLEEQQYQDYLDGKTDHRRLKKIGLNNLFTKLKNTEDKYKWLKKFDATTLKIVLFDVNHAYEMFLSNTNNNERPKYKSRIYSKKQFPIRPERLQINETHARIPSIGFVKYYNSYGDEILGSGHESSPNRINFYNARIIYDGINYYLVFSIPKDREHNVNSYFNYAKNAQWKLQKNSEPIGIDVGLKRDKWLVDSTGKRVVRPDCSRLQKKADRLNRKLQRQRKINKSKNRSFYDQHPDGSNNMQKTKVEINKCFKKISNVRKNSIYEYTKSLLEKKPKAIVMEAITISDFIIHSKYTNKQYKNRMNKLITEASLYETMHIIEDKMLSNGIPVIKAESDYPSSQLCSCCGYRQNIGRRKTYKCPNCGTKIDRDLNAAINLAKLAY